MRGYLDVPIRDEIIGTFLDGVAVSQVTVRWEHIFGFWHTVLTLEESAKWFYKFVLMIAGKSNDCEDMSSEYLPSEMVLDNAGVLAKKSHFRNWLFMNDCFSTCCVHLPQLSIKYFCLLSLSS